MSENGKSGVEDWLRSLNSSPLFKRIASSLGYERIGILIIKESDVDEYTAFAENGEIREVRKGMHNPDFVAKINIDKFRGFDEKDGEWAVSNPLQAAAKYWDMIELPLSVKLRIGLHLLKGVGE